MEQTYCAPAPPPYMLLRAWNLDYSAAGLCAVLLVCYFIQQTRGSIRCMVAAISLIIFAFVSPLCALTAALFAARVAHHALLIAVIAPLLALAFPEPQSSQRRMSLAWLTAVHAAVLWIIHAPPVYAFAIVGAAPYWAMQLALGGSAVLLWRRILSPATSSGAAMLSILATVAQMGLLGALLTFAREPLYEPHFTTTLPYGLTPLADQQLAGLIMWVPASIPYLVLALLKLHAQLAPSPRTPA